ncbi:hypothetical protein L9F63_024418, partial [Diploptera punctata]
TYYLNLQSLFQNLLNICVIIAFSQKSKLAEHTSLNAHLLVHRNHKPFNCSHCNKPFASKTKLIRHLRLHTLCNITFYPISPILYATTTFDYFYLFYFQ